MSSRSLDKIKSSWTRVILTTLLSGDASLSDVRTMAARAVPPGRAIRKWKRYQQSDVKSPTDADKIRTGARIIASGSIHSLQQKGMVDIYKSDGVSFLTLTDKGRKRYGHQED